MSFNVEFRNLRHSFDLNSRAGYGQFTRLSGYESVGIPSTSSAKSNTCIFSKMTFKEGFLQKNFQIYLLIFLGFVISQLAVLKEKQSPCQNGGKICDQGEWRYYCQKWITKFTQCGKLRRNRVVWLPRRLKKKKRKKRLSHKPLRLPCFRFLPWVIPNIKREIIHKS